MRLNQYIARSTGLSRRAADRAIAEGRIAVNGQSPTAGQSVEETDSVTLDNRAITPAVNTITIMLNKPTGYICSRDGQGSKTVYELLPKDLHQLKPVGRLDKDSSGLLLMTDDGQLAYELTHPKFNKTKVYQIRLNKPLTPGNFRQLKAGIMLEDGLSKLDVRVKSQESRVKRETGFHAAKTHDSYLMTRDSAYEVRMSEGRNRQIRRTFEALGYSLPKLHRVQFGDYKLNNLPTGKYATV